MLLVNNFFPALFINILIFISYGFCIFVVFNSLLNSKYFREKEQNKIFNILITSLMGASSSCFSFVYSSWSSYSVFIFFFIPFIFILSYKFGRYFSIGAFPVVCIAIGLCFIENNNINVLIIGYVLAFLCLTSGVVSSFVRWKISYIFAGLIFIIFTITALSSVVVYTKIFNEASYMLFPTSQPTYLYYGMLNLFSFISCLILFTTLKIYTKFIFKSRKIETQTQYKNGFLISKDFTSNINNFIYENNINRAVILLLKFNGIDELLTSKSASYVHKLIANNLVKLHDKLKDYTFLPYMNSNQYFLFIKLDNNEQIDINLSKLNNGSRRRKIDFLYKYEEILKSIIEKEVVANKTLKISLSGNCLIYGVQSNKINDINSFLLSSLRNVPINSGCINLLDAESFYNKYSNYNKNKLLEDIDLFKPNEIEISINLEKTSKGKNYYISNAMILKKLLLNKTDFYKISPNNYINDVVMCHISALSIKEFVHKKLNKQNNFLIIDYPYNILSGNKINVDDLINSITSYNLSINQIIINVIRTSDNRDNDKQLYKNINLLKKSNLKCVIRD